MFVKLEITGTLEVLTGMHIGGSSAFAAIGAVDSPVVRDTFSDQPMIPGSSLKGKMRALLAQNTMTENIFLIPVMTMPLVSFGCLAARRRIRSSAAGSSSVT